MAMAKRDQERAGYAWMYGAQARKDGKDRSVPDYWHDYADAWLQGFDGEFGAGAAKPKPVSYELESELDEAALSEPPSDP